MPETNSCTDTFKLTKNTFTTLIDKKCLFLPNTILSFTSKYSWPITNVCRTRCNTKHDLHARYNMLITFLVLFFLPKNIQFTQQYAPDTTWAKTFDTDNVQWATISGRLFKQKCNHFRKQEQLSKFENIVIVCEIYRRTIAAIL